MNRNDRKPVDRCAEILLALRLGKPRHDISPGQAAARREEINALLGRLDDRAILDVLERIYRQAERDARRRATRLARAVAPPTQRSLPAAIASLLVRWFTQRL